MSAKKMINLNGELIPADKPVFTSANRAFRYGDGLFETIRMIRGRIPLFDLHFPRLVRGCELLKFDRPESMNQEFWLSEILKLTEQQGISENARIRLTLFRRDGGFYQPTSNEIEYLIEVEPWKEKGFPLNEEGYVVDLYADLEKPVSLLANYKTCNALVYVLAARHRSVHNVNDCLLVNWRSRVIESINSNVFILQDGIVHTPPLTEGCVGGVMRAYTMKLMESNGIPYQESPLPLEDIFQADEMFLTNAVQGIRWVKGYKVKIYKNDLSKELSRLLNETLA